MSGSELPMGISLSDDNLLRPIKPVALPLLEDFRGVSSKLLVSLLGSSSRPFVLLFSSRIGLCRISGLVSGAGCCMEDLLDLKPRKFGFSSFLLKLKK